MARLVPISLTSGDLVSETDGLVLILSSLDSLAQKPGVKALGSTIVSKLEHYLTLDATAHRHVSMVVVPEAPGSRIILAPVGSLVGDTDDVRKFGETASKAIAKCLAVGIRKPTVLIVDNPLNNATERIATEYQKYLEVTLLGLVAETYEPLQQREFKKNPDAITEIRVATTDSNLDDTLISTVNWVHAVEEGRILARDIGGGDPERMSPLNCASYIEKAFAGVPNVKVTLITAHDVLKKEFPLLHAVARCSLMVPAHHPVVVRLEYHAADQSQVSENVFLIGKGVTYDTGGADIKYGGSMRGMSRDKCGAAACAGFMKTVSLLKPNHVNVIADLGFVRNSSGAANYVSDEIILSRAGLRVLVGNTDAEGRMVMADLLASAKERALAPQYASTPSRLLTVATLTGHAVRAVGTGYNISLDNGPARESGISKRLFDAGHLYADPFETSTLRREDYNLVKPCSGTEDVIQANDKPSTQTNRGHQYPAAFLSVTSGISKHGLDSEFPISYTHCDIAASAEGGSNGLSLPIVTGCPVVAFTATFATKK